MRLIIQPDYKSVSKWIAKYITQKINFHQTQTEKPFVLGFPTGSSPLGTYKELIKLFSKGEISFRNVITFNMDEYVGIPKNHPESYFSFMHRNLFNKIDISSKNINILDGNSKDLEDECIRFEEKIKAVGGIDLFLGGVGTDGHIAFNEPGSSLSSRTRIKTLNIDTRISNSRFFNNNINAVPKFALTVGVGTVMDAKEILVIVNGYNKANALYHAIEGGISQMWTISALQLHPNAVVVCDEPATYNLKVGTYRYFKDIEKNNL